MRAWADSRRALFFAGSVVLLASLLLPAGPAMAAVGTVVEHALPTPASHPFGIHSRS